MDGVVQAWVTGWVVSRGAAPPEREPWGFTVDVGQLAQVSRHVFDALGDEVDERLVRKVADGVTGAGVWLKVFQDPEVVGDWLGEGWWVDPEPGCLMTVPLAGAAVGGTDVPDGYRKRVWSTGGVTRVLLAAPDGSLAARGQTAPTGATAVFDQIETASAHRRRGLGSVVMRTLQATAAAAGAETGVLAGTPAGRALYESLGWHVEAPLTSAKFMGRDAG
ncbi:GNAT family N-acetyltransferase [Streptomyces sp. SAI-041]|uniref:GNAT family N-acetyltransferase n=1 Tax=Streptomyces sp. SAI-041 TaxID=2940548 RepID=UPI002475B0F0|nr:GNAT family N-acetyltransferase [Streptomyces sp. SAI-041]MDH6548762.1 GNAT superfamily N-acetyltransferase [Streptomyces sp. SAI-041]